MQEDNSTLGYLHKEYERRSSLISTYSSSYFEDFKLLGALGLVFAWEPIASHLKQDGDRISNEMVFTGFMVTLAISVVISLNEILKLSMIRYHHRQLEFYEMQLRKYTGQEGAGTFRDSDNWKEWFETRHKYLGATYSCVYWIILIGFSVVALNHYTNSVEYILYYLLAAVSGILTQAGAGYILYRNDKPVSK